MHLATGVLCRLPKMFALLATVLSVSMSMAYASATESIEKPNIVFILIDDLGWSDLGCYGHAFHETPHVDRLARQGMRFTDFYAAGPVCSPTRASIQSGQYTPRTGITNFIPGHWRPFEKLVEPPNAPHMSLDVVTIAEALRAAAYRTGHFGKWHLGGQTHFPEQQGYDVSVVTGGPHFGTNVVTRPPRRLPPDVYLADFLTDRTIEFIEQNRDRPFFIHLSHFAVHIPLQAKEAEIEKYAKKPKPPQGINHPVYAAMVAHVDQSVGRIVAVLDRLKLTEKTVVIFTSDNGGLRQRYDGQGDVVSTNAPLRDEKGSLYEGGIRVPLIVRWPGVIRPGNVCREPTVSVDFYPTLLDIAGAARPAGHVLDGASLVPLMKQEDGFSREAIFFHYPHYHQARPAGAIRAGDLKLLEFFDDGTLEMYNLREDLGEQTNLAEKMPQTAQSLRERLETWRKSVGAEMPAENPDCDPRRAKEWWSRRTKKPL